MLRIEVGSTNSVKVAAVQRAFEKHHAGYPVPPVTGYNTSPGIEPWKSLFAIGQPFFLEQTVRGATNRANATATHMMESPGDRDFAVGVENGLVPARELGLPDSDKWYDLCIVAVLDLTSHEGVIHQGTPVLTEFRVSPDANQEMFDQAVQEYEALIMPKIRSGIDLCMEWTVSFPGGPFTRGHFIAQSTLACLHELDQRTGAEEILGKCVRAGMAASCTSRYKYMVWSRDLDYMLPAYVKYNYKSQAREALDFIASRQVQEHHLHDWGYGAQNQMGKIPIVCIAPEHQVEFLQQRLFGSLEEPGWELRLRAYWTTQPVESRVSFPELPIEFTVETLRTYWSELQRVKQAYPQAPGSSFALTHYIQGTLENLTPGTQDSEIHFIRAVTRLGVLDASIVSALVKAFFYLYLNVIDPRDGLPRGADTRDTFADLLVDSKLLTNAVFWYTALGQLVDCRSQLIAHNFCEQLTELVTGHKAQFPDLSVPPILSIMCDDPQLDSLGFLRDHLRKNIQFRLLCVDQAPRIPRDFLPGPRARTSLTHPVHPTPITELVVEFQPHFPLGITPDPQGLAQAILHNLLPVMHFERAIDIFKATDSPIGITVFVPISGKNPEETAVLHAVKGQVVWPHITWKIIEALRHMKLPRAMALATQQHQKLMQHCGCGEWYAWWNDKVFCGGEREQGWSAATMLTC